MSRSVPLETKSVPEASVPLCVPQRVSRQALLTPHAVAIAAGSAVLTYAELEKQANQLAHHLRSVDAGPDRLIGLYLRRSPAFIVAALAVLKSGAAYLPLDPDSPPERVAFMLHDSAVSVLVTSGSLEAQLPRGPWQVVDLDRDAPQIRDQAARAPETESRPGDLAYVIYTSGSTGQPKGVEVAHSSLMNLVCWHSRTFQVGPGDRASFLAALGFDAAVWELWPYLTAGASVHIPGEGIRNNVAALRDWLLEQRITISFAVTAMAESLLTLDWPPETPLRILLTGADALHRRPPANAPFTLVNNYGPTEYTVVATSGAVQPASTTNSPSIGRPIDNTTVYVLDDAMRPLRQGETGELYLGGAGLARGYRNRPDLTAERFVPHPFSGGNDSRLYRTGDLVRVLLNGEIEFAGRVDEQVKIRGFRIEPNEVVAVLNSCAGVQTSAVVARQEPGGEKRLIAYVVRTPGATLIASTLRDQLQKLLPDYMIPAALVEVDSIPTTANGKVDRLALPEPTSANMFCDEGYLAPEGLVEERLAAIIAPLLRVDRVGVNDNFFLLGGHSLLGTQLITRISESFGINLPLLSLFDHPTVAGMSAEIERLILAKIQLSEGTDSRSLAGTSVEVHGGEVSPIVVEAQPDPAESRTHAPQKNELLEAIVAHPDECLSLLPPLSAAERHRILIEWNQTEAPYPADKCIHQLIEAQAERTPHAIAVEHERERLTYHDFNQRANQLAHYLRKLGVGPDVPVGICLEPSLTLSVALLAVLKANGACLPLDPEYPKDRLQLMVEDARIPVLLSHERLSSDLAGTSTQIVCVDRAWETISQESGSNPRNNISPQNLAYVIYTSGSTGKPKGVMLTHGGLVNYITAAINVYGLKATDRLLQFSSISFDIAIEEMYPTWVVGATLVFRSGDFSLAGSDFLTWARQQKLTVVSIATAYWHELVHELSESGASLPESLRLMLVGGEKAQMQVLEAWRRVAGSGVRWINTYGPTETSVIATAYELSSSGPLPDPVPIGRPIGNMRIHILDGNLQPVPVGVAGEIHIGGPGLARGYLNCPDITAAKFIPDPFSSGPQAKLYQTGDLARYLPNGEIEFVGRRDFQIKIRGFRVEPGEIESVLGRHSSVRDAVVVSPNDGLSTKRLVAYVVPVAGLAPSAAELRSWLRKQLPDYMIPSDFVFLEELTLTPNGKVDRRALSAQPVAHVPSEDRATPGDPVESQLTRIWEEILAKRPIGGRENFFELGGHSLLAVRLMRRIEQGFGRKLPLVTLFEAPTIEQLAAILRQDGSPSNVSLVVPIQARGHRPPFFCVHGLGGAVLRFQELARHMAPDQPFYGIQPQGIDGGMAFLDSVEQMASCYIREMRKVQPEGPYFIGGYSFGGLVAFEMACQLRAGDQEVAFLGLVDTYPGKAKSNAVLLGTLLALPLRQQMAYATRKIERYTRGLRRRFDTVFLPKPLKQVRKILAKAESAYQPRIYFGSATWLRASEKTLRRSDNPRDDWSQWITGDVEIQEIDGDHGSIMKEPTVTILAEKLRSCLLKAQQKCQEEMIATRVSLETCQ
jgi:amino acid adenylation domain-containing protein